MINIALHLNAYQPPTQLSEVISRIMRESYEPVIAALEQNPHALISLNLTRCLGERLPKELLLRIRRLYSHQRIEFQNTAASHYLLPLVPPSVVLRQLALNLEFYREYFVGINEVSGIYLPELAFAPWLANVLKDAGYVWTMLDDGPFDWKRKGLAKDLRVPLTWVPIHKDPSRKNDSGLICLLRSRYWSERIAQGKYDNGRNFADELLASHERWVQRYFEGVRASGYRQGDSYLLLVCDFETFGHHPVGPNGPKDAIDRFLVPFLNRIAEASGRARLVTPSHIVERFERCDSTSDLVEGSWTTEEQHLIEGNPFYLWNHPANEFHRAWNEFMGATFRALLRDSTDPEFVRLTDQAFYSCSPWQYSYHDKGVACWCLPMFQQILDRPSARSEIDVLTSSYQKLEELCR